MPTSQWTKELRGLVVVEVKANLIITAGCPSFIESMACRHLFCSASPALRQSPRTASQFALSADQLWVSVALGQHAISMPKQLQAKTFSISYVGAKRQGDRGFRPCQSNGVAFSSSTFSATQGSREVSEGQTRRDVVSGEVMDGQVAVDDLARLGNVIDILEQRGLIESTTGKELRAACCQPETAPVKVYAWFDASLESLHLGNLVGINLLSWFQRCGHVPVAVLGGATHFLPDLAGKRLESSTLRVEVMQRNSRALEENICSLLGGRRQKSQTSMGLRTPQVFNSYDWWSKISILDFLRDVGKYATVSTMMATDGVRKQLQSEEGLSFMQFTHQLIRGYDFVHLFKDEGVRVQIGDTDEWGNISAGTDLVRKILQEDAVHGLTHPVLLRSDGSKVGTSGATTVWLTPSLTSPYMLYQHLFATEDCDVIKFLKVLTFLSLEEIASIEASMRRWDYVPNAAQRKLAEEVTRFVHGCIGLREAVNATTALAPGGSSGLDASALEAVTADVPSFCLLREAVVGMSVVELCTISGLLTSKGAARRLIQQGGLYLNNAKVEGEGKTLKESDLVGAKLLLLGAGKKRKLLVRVVDALDT